MSIEEKDTKLRGYLEVKLGSRVGINYRRLARKCWRRQWVVMDLVETLDSPALIARIYGSHLHEDRNLPISTITLTDIHALHRAQSRSHQYAFSIDGSGQSLMLSGSSETDSYLWMKSIRDVLWSVSSHAVPFWTLNKYPTHVAYEVSLIDNVHSDIARLRGFYGHLVIEASGREVLLVEARSGMDQVRWPIKLLKKWFVATKVSAKEDRNKILVIITHKNSSSGEGIFSFYSPQAKDIVEALKTGANNKTKKKVKVNPLKAFFPTLLKL
ncbi:unnamed protein product [Lepeophtheirus salmonis]|uniref:(salmon louse) hypothetical protein n=1 Tax=Lepeophtheirus salmonis TaxID=72036 RepID=A0A7R8H3A0_LEPSM|nr:unnamed protein product [Lepeophtheirus salmonis]CAF2828094.1 unnamed protein product [Lepeophtheirus salmonis]